MSALRFHRLLCVAVLAIGLLTWTPPASAKASFDPASVYRVALGASPQQGPREAPITIVEFSDFACGYCVRVQYTLRQLQLLYPNAIRWVHRSLPLDTDNILAAEAALAAHAQGRYGAMRDRLYELRGRVDRIDVELLAQALGLDVPQFRKDIDDGRFRAAVRADEAAAQALGVSGTPTFFINGRVVNGAASLHDFVAVIEPELARAAAALRDGTTAAELYGVLTNPGKSHADVAGPEQAGAGFELDGATGYKVGLGLPGHQQGPADALVTIVVWSDFECPFCARAAPVLAKLRSKMPSHVRLVFRHLPMVFHRNGSLASEAAVEAGVQGKFWDFHDALFLHLLNKGGLSRPELEQVAMAAGLGLPNFRTALNDRRHRDAVRADAAAGLALGIDGTPTMFFNGVPVVGAKSFPMLEAIVLAHIETASAAIRRNVKASDIYALALAEAKDEDRGDPAAVPVVKDVAGLALRDLQRGWALAAACRRVDIAAASALWSGMAQVHRRQLQATCGAAGVVLAPHAP
ncbi:MAG: thioredoxin domain-containing protein [Kofleriaceae bacterium]|nr:thioredoxin domain-containing protein [Kofleriaceae bacterium]